MKNVQCFVKHQEKEATNHKTPESEKSGSPGISEQTGKKKKVDSGTVPQEKVRTVLSNTKKSRPINCQSVVRWRGLA